jgi:hypothetical protein
LNDFFSALIVSASATGLISTLRNKVEGKSSDWDSQRCNGGQREHRTAMSAKIAFGEKTKRPDNMTVALLLCPQQRARVTEICGEFRRFPIR